MTVSEPVEYYYDLSIASEYKLVGKRSSKHPSLAETLEKMMRAKANFVLVIKRGADMEDVEWILSENK